MSSEYTMDAATASEAKDDVAQGAPPAVNAHRSVRFPHGPPPAVNAHMSLPVLDSPVPDAGARAQAQRSQQESKEEDDAKWFYKMRGWVMVVAVQVASSTYQAGLNPPSRFSGATHESTSYRYNIFFYSNMTAFVTSLAIIILLMSKTFFHSKHKVVMLEIVVVLDMVGLMAAYWASTSNSFRDQTAKYTLMVTVFVLFVVYVVYTVQLLTKLKTLWYLAAAEAAAAVAAAAAAVVAAAAAPRRVHAGDAAPGGAAPVPSQIDEARSTSLSTSQQRLSATPRRRGSKRSAGTIEPSRMMSP